MRHIRTGLLLFVSLAISTLSIAQIRGMGITSTDRARGSTAAGAAAASRSLAFRNGGTFFGVGTVFPKPFPHHPFPHHRPFGFNWWGNRWAGNWAGSWPVSYGGYIPFDYDYNGYDMNPGYYTGYVPGTFNSTPYPGYPYPPGYAGPPAPGNAPQASYYPSGPLIPPSSQPNAPEMQSSNRSDSSTTSTAKHVTTANGPEDISEPTVLVFRDGHKQEVQNYAIMGSTVFVLSGRRARIPIAELDVPETVRQNQNRGLEFRIPDQAQ